jgi:hypothetical protein
VYIKWGELIRRVLAINTIGWLDKEVKTTERKLSILFFIIWLLSLWGIVGVSKQLPLPESFQMLLGLFTWIALPFYFSRVDTYYRKLLEERTRCFYHELGVKN